jgi:urease beta subunit
MIPGEVFPGPTPVTINAGRPAVEIDVVNAGDRPIQVGSHFHFFEVNRALHFERARAYGRRLDIAAGTAVRFEPGETRRVALVPFGGRRAVHGLNGLTQGHLDEAEPRARARVAAFTAGAILPADQAPDAS